MRADVAVGVATAVLPQAHVWGRPLALMLGQEAEALGLDLEQPPLGLAPEEQVRAQGHTNAWGQGHRVSSVGVVHAHGLGSVSRQTTRAVG